MDTYTYIDTPLQKKYTTSYNYKLQHREHYEFTIHLPFLLGNMNR